MFWDDSLWKNILENVFEDFLKFFFKGAEKIFDLKKGFCYLDKELDQIVPTEDMSAPKFVDKLVKVYRKGGGEEWILVHIEVQGYSEAAFEERMFTYFHRIKDRYNKPITAFAILTDNNKAFRPAFYRYSCLGTQLIYRFNMMKIMDLREEELLKSNNPFAVVLLTVQLAIRQKQGLNPQDLLGLKINLARNLLRRQFPVDKVKALMSFLKFYIRFDDQRLNDNFEKEFSSITEKQENMGIEEYLLFRAEEKGKAQGTNKTKTLFVSNLLEQTDHSIEKIAKLAEVSEEFVVNIKSRA